MGYSLTGPDDSGQERTGSEEASKCDASSAERPSNILVVDGEAAVRDRMSAILEQDGHRVKVVSTSSEALRVLEDGRYDLVLTEIVLREMGGVALLEEIHRRQPHLPVVLVSAVREISVALDAMRSGAFDYLLKPFEPEQLLATVARALGYRLVLTESHNYKQNLEEMVRARTEMLLHAIEDLEHSYDVTLEALGDALDLKDSETEGHSRRVTAFTMALARAMGLAPAEIKMIARGAFLHDIGKMAIPDRILRKPGKLTGEEKKVMREHCTRGYQILRKIPFLAAAAEIVLCHQEHYDGRGYPSGLRGSEIPIGARIFSVADAMDAMTSDRPYRKARSFEAAREEIVRRSGSQFDPEVVEVFLKMPERLWQELRVEIGGQDSRTSTLGEPWPRGKGKNGPA